MSFMPFREDFVWGAATSAYQIEGHSLADGGGASVWDTFCHTPGKTFEGNTGDIACDSYHRYLEDIALLKEMGLSAYRFSSSWARIDPRGDGTWNPGGLAYYDRVVDACLDAGITPWLTLYHWELPQALEDRGGWLNPETATAFARFAGMMAEHFKGRIGNYFTLNEPQCAIGLGYGTGAHAPGKQLDLAGQFTCWKHILMAHGEALRAVKKVDPSAQVGIAATGRICYPETEKKADIEAARQAMFAGTEEGWTFTYHMALDPICLGRFPECAGTALEPLVNAVTREELDRIHAVPDLLGYNMYNGWAVRADENGQPFYVPRYEGFPRTALKWPVTPEIMDWGVRFLGERYGLPAYITENGVSCNDKIFLDGRVHDPDRIDFLHRYLRCLKRAAEQGADIRGYFHWALMDNYEWNSGYSERLGLVFMDYPNLRRIPKDSAAWYRDVAATNGEIL